MRLQLTDEARELLADVGFDPVRCASAASRSAKSDALSEVLFGERLARLSRLASPERWNGLLPSMK